MGEKAIFVQALYITAISIPVIIHVFIHSFLWHDINMTIPDSTMSKLYYYLNFIWFIPLPWIVMNVLGLLFGPPADKDISNFADWTWDSTEALLIIAYVSRGDNQKALKRAVLSTQQQLDNAGVKYVIEIVTDIKINQENIVQETNGKNYYYLVPNDYETQTKVRFKARALQYLLEMRTQRINKEDMVQDIDNVWILHLDEESMVTSKVIPGIKDFILKYNLKITDGAIGQGEIHYNACNYGKNMFITAIDALRTGDDLGRFRLQYKIFHKPLIGMHGSFVLIPAKIEEKITWDSGAKSCLTEDAYFALLAAEKKIKFDWVKGFVQEQSPFSVKDIIKQRARWYTGLVHVSTDNNLQFSNRFIMMIYMVVWTFAWFGGPLLLFDLVVVKLFLNFRFFPFWTTFTISVLTGLICSLYTVGVYRNVSYLKIPFMKKAKIVIGTYILFLLYIPMFVESTAVIYSIYRRIFNPIVDFHIVDK